MLNRTRWLIPNLKDKHKNTRAAIFVYILLLCGIFSIVLYFVNIIFDLKSEFPFLKFCVGVVSLIFLFKATSSFTLIGNILGVLTSFVFFTLSTKTGGIYSEDLHSVFLLPLIVFLVAGIRSGIFWFIITSCWIIYSFYQINSPEQIAFFKNQTSNFEPAYYLVFAFLNLTLTCMIVGILHYQYEKLIKKQAANQKALEAQTGILEQTQKELKASNKELDQYAYSTAHDLKQPIRTIYSFTGLLEKELKKPEATDTKIDEYIGIIQKSSSNMNQLVTDLLEYSQLDNKGKKSFTKVSLNKVVDNVKNDVRDLIDKTNTKIHSQDLPTILAMPVHLNQLFLNLIYNAIKFKHDQRDPILSISHTETEDATIISIKDNGIGIKESKLHEIFNPFKKLHSSKDYEGSGIGLATCSKIVSMHEGKIWVESKVGIGTTFHFSIKKDLQ